MIEKDHKDLSVVRQGALPEVSRSGLYYEPVKESEENLSISPLPGRPALQNK